MPLTNCILSGCAHPWYRAAWSPFSKKFEVGVRELFDLGLATATMQSTEVAPVPIHVALSVHWLPFAAEFVVNVLDGRFMTALDARYKGV